MAQTNNNLNNTYNLGKGITPHFSITYDDSLSQADGQDRANALMAVCEVDYNWMSNFFGGISLPFSLPVAVQIVPGPFAGAGWGPPITLTPGNGSAIDLVRYLLVSEVVEMFMESKDNGWGYSYGDSNEGSKGEALSRFLGYLFLSKNGLNTSVLTQGGGTFFVSNQWLSTSTRTDFVNNNPDDNHPDATTGCTTLFLYYLNAQLNFDIKKIIDDGASTLAGVYTNLTGDIGDPFPFFARLLANSFPGTNTINTGPNFDNPFPLGILSFWVDKNTFGRDEVQDIVNNQNGLISNAFWLVLEGFSIDSYNSLGISIPTPSGSFSRLGGITISPSPVTPGGPTPANPIPEFEDPTNTKAPQRIRFSFDIKFSNLNAFPAVGGSPVTGELDATAQVGGKNLQGTTAAAGFELLAGADPYFTNVDPSNQNDVFYLSQDLRVFSVIAGDSPLSGAQAFTADPYASIQSLIGYLNGNSAYTTPNSNDPLNALPGQTGYETGDSSVTPADASGNKRYNFAVARVRLRGAASDSASNVRVFFRLFVAQSFDTDFQPTTTYKSNLGNSGTDLNHPVFPLASGTGIVDPSGQTIQTIPFFATDSSGTHDYDGSVANANIRTIQIPAGKDNVWAYFGCFLDVYDANNNSKFAGTHHCIVAEIAYSDAPIPTITSTGTTPSPANWDQLAQRNLQITLSENPKSPATHVIPQAFDLRPSRPLAMTTGAPLDLPDEIMIDWGNTPLGSTASVYWPQLNADDVVALANKIYSSHLLSVSDSNTIMCKVTKGVTYIPIPSANNVNFAGLLTIDLPTYVKNGQVFNILVRRVSTRRFATEPMAPIKTNSLRKGLKNAAHNRALVERISKIKTWRLTTGAFQVRIPVTTKSVMLRIEENSLAVLKWRLEEMSKANRWYPVIQRYVSLIAARVDGLGGNAGSVPPSLNGATRGGQHKKQDEHEDEYIGKVVRVIYDRFGDFEGFVLKTESGEEVKFHSSENEVGIIVFRAWKERWIITVTEDRSHENSLRTIVLRRAPGAVERERANL